MYLPLSLADILLHFSNALRAAFTALSTSFSSVYRHYDFSYSEDAHSYVSMAQWNYKNISMTHQYRFIEPTIAGVIALPINSVYDKIWTERGGIEWSVRLAFFLENVLLMAFFWYDALSNCATRRHRFLVCDTRYAVFINNALGHR